MKTEKIAGLLTVGLLLVASAAQAEIPYATAWTRQIGSNRGDYAYGVAVDAGGNVYITGSTGGDLDGINAGSGDAFLIKYDGSGTLAWTRQFGSDSSDYARKVAVDTDGNVYVTGTTLGDLGGANAGDYDAFLVKYDSDGNQLWMRQFGTAVRERSWDVAVGPGGNVYITGETGGVLGAANAGGVDAFLRKYDGSGTHVWTQQLGTGSTDHGWSVAADAGGNVYITGHTEGGLDGNNAGGHDAFLSKYDSSGTRAWTRQLGSVHDDIGYGVAVDAGGNAYITGRTSDDLGGTHAGAYDAFLIKYDSSGTRVWASQLGTPSNDTSYSVVVDAAGNVYITGFTGGVLGEANAGTWDAFLSKYDASGTLVWTHQLGTDSTDESWDVAVDAGGNVYITGFTGGDLAGPNASAGGYDAFLVKYDVPEPATLSLLVLGGLVLLRRRGKRRASPAHSHHPAFRPDGQVANECDVSSGSCFARKGA